MRSTDTTDRGDSKMHGDMAKKNGDKREHAAGQIVARTLLSVLTGKPYITDYGTELHMNVHEQCPHL